MGGGKDPPGPWHSVTPAMKEQQKVNAEMWNYYQKEYQPLIEKYAGEVTSPANQAAERGKVAGEINAEVMKKVDPANFSVNPVDTTKKMGELAKMETGAQVTGQGGVRSRNIGETQNIINIGRGEATEAMAGLDTVARQSLAMNLGAQELEMEKEAGKDETIGSAIGTAGAIGMKALKKPKTMDGFDTYLTG